MPTYSYACTACDHRFDTVQAFTDASLTECPECAGRLRKLFSSVGIVFKGSGFYRTDSRAKSDGGDGKSESNGTTEGKSGDKSAEKSQGGAKSESSGSGSSSSTSSDSGSGSSGSSGSGSGSAGSSGPGSSGSGSSSSTGSAKAAGA